jgi:diguanylate cyclase (GGDEF)-like protein/PAS domain S-box-containing protein
VQFVLIRLFFQHDLRLVALAALLCALSCFVGTSLLAHAQKTSGPMRRAWIGVAAVSVGFGIWATHFIAMLAFASGMPLGYELWETLASLAVAIIVTGSGLWFAANGPGRVDSALGGALVGLGITAMHYVGMAAMIVGGAIRWDFSLVAASAVIGMSFGALAMHLGTRGPSLRWRLSSALMLTIAICAMHFTGMGAVDLANCFAVLTPEQATPAYMATGIGVGSIIILGFAFAGVFLDLRDRRRSALEAGRMRGLANAAIEGLVVCDGDTIVTVNSSFLQMAGRVGEDLAGHSLADLLGEATSARLHVSPEVSVEAQLAAKGGALPVEVILRPVDFGGRQHFAIAVRDLSSRKQAEQHIRFLAHHDALTGIANRASFNARLDDELGKARRAESGLSVLCLDLDRFKEVNDLFGHAAGDDLLQRVGNVLMRATTGDELAARLGGDEFAILLPAMVDHVTLAAKAELIFALFRSENGAMEGALISASIGIASFPADAADAEQLMSHADTALYRAKQDGRGVHRFYDAQMGAALLDRRLIEHDLRHAIARGQLRLVYQPQADIGTGIITGFEALMRWAHPERGNIPPDTFISIAEESGLILQLGEWALRTACREAASWSPSLSIAVNVSAVQVHSHSFARTLLEILVTSGLSPERLELEVTESALINDADRALATLRQIKAHGVRIAMDDFGTGYSSLSNLRAFPFDRIKVDRPPSSGRF